PSFHNTTLFAWLQSNTPNVCHHGCQSNLKRRLIVSRLLPGRPSIFSGARAEPRDAGVRQGDAGLPVRCRPSRFIHFEDKIGRLRSADGHFARQRVADFVWTSGSVSSGISETSFESSECRQKARAATPL